MALYLGDKKLQINIQDIVYQLNLWKPLDLISDKLLSSEGYILKDFNNLYLTTKEEK